MSQPPNKVATAVQSPSPLVVVAPPRPLLRGLEGDLRALCADSKRRGPAVKEAAERVILLLREAESPDARAEAAGEATAALCAFCHPPDHAEGAAAVAAQTRVAVRAVACLHRLLTHRAAPAARLGQLIDALERLGVGSADDAITLKVLQALLSLLTVPDYLYFLPEQELARAFSLLFKLRSARAGSSSTTAAAAAAVVAAAAAGPLAAISAAGGQVTRPDADDGVIELTAKAAFRQVASDLFSCASEAMRMRLTTTTSNTTSTAEAAVLPDVVRAAHGLFQDLCFLTAGGNPQWLLFDAATTDAHRIDLVLALEVMDDGLSANVSLFLPPQAYFSDLLSVRLCPALHELLREANDRTVLKALFGLIVTLIRRFWTHLLPDTETFLSTMTKLIDLPHGVSPSWVAYYAMEALRSAMRMPPAHLSDHAHLDATAVHSSDIILSMFKTFDAQQEENRPLIAGMIRAVCVSTSNCATATIAAAATAASEQTPSEGFGIALSKLPVEPLQDLLKSYTLPLKDIAIHFIGSGAGLCLLFCAAARAASDNREIILVKSMLTEPTVTAVVAVLDRLLREAPAATNALDGTESALGLLADGLVNISVAADVAGIPEVKTAALIVLANSCRVAVSALELKPGYSSWNPESRVVTLYRALFSVARACGEKLGQGWREFARAVEPLDLVLFGETSISTGADGDSNLSTALSSCHLPNISPTLAAFRAEVDSSFSAAASLSWDARCELVSVLVVSSRASMVSFTNRSSSDDILPPADSSGSKISGEMRIFGIARAEFVMSSVFAHQGTEAGPMPQGLWQLLTGHLVAVACDSTTAAIRVNAIKALVRIAATALETQASQFVSQDKILSPISDLLSSSYMNTREGCLDAVYTILETRGEFLKGSGAWAGILGILRAASGIDMEDSIRPAESANGANAKHTSGNHQHAVDEGFALRDRNLSNLSVDHVILSQPNQVQHRAVQGAQGEVAMVQRGFRAVQLIADDFLSFLASETLSDWVDVLGRYCRQSDDVNVALTAVGLLWRTADYVAKIGGSGGYDSLWMELFEVLKAIGSDDRPEVRNGAVKTLTSTLKAHGGQLSAVAWRGCVERALLPLLEEVMQGGGTGLTAQTGTPRNRANPELVLHYTRDTPRKQWNETRVLALGGVAGVLRLAMPRLASLRDNKDQSLLTLLVDGGSEGLWAKMLRAAGAAGSSTENEVSFAGVGALLELLNASGSIVPTIEQPVLKMSVSAPETRASAESETNIQASSSWISGLLGTSATSERLATFSEGLTDSQCDLGTVTISDGALALWEAVWAAVGDAVRGRQDISDSRITNTKSLVLLVTGLGRAREELVDRFSHKSSLALLNILRDLMAGPDFLDANLRMMSNEKSAGQGGEITEVQRRAIAVTQSLSFGDDIATWSALVAMLSHLIDRRHCPSLDLIRYRLVRVLETLYREDRLPNCVKSAELGTVVEALGPTMLQHHVLVAESVGMRSPNSVDVRHTVGTAMISSTISGSPPDPSSSGGGGGMVAMGDAKHTELLGDEDGDVLWSVAVKAFVNIVISGLEAGAPKANMWGAFRRVVHEFLYSPQREIYDAHVQPRSVVESSVLDEYDVRMALCVRDALVRIADGVGHDAQCSLVDLITRGAQEGMRGRRARFVRACQSALFSLADAHSRYGNAPSGVHVVVADRAATCVVEVSDAVLRRYVSDDQRAGKCPLPAAQRAEAVFLLKRLHTLRLRTDGDDARRHLHTLHARLCECVDVEDEAIRSMAHAVLNEFTPTGDE